jgi:hypothetical protein
MVPNIDVCDKVNAAIGKLCFGFDVLDFDCRHLPDELSQGLDRSALQHFHGFWQFQHMLKVLLLVKICKLTFTMPASFSKC